MNIRHFTILCSRLLTLLIVYSFIRIAFYIVYFELYIDQPFTDIAGSFFHGVRFDIAALCWINAPLFLLLPFRHKIPKIDRFVFYFLNTLGVLAGLVDLKLFHFNGKRLSKEFFTSLQKDFWDQLAQVAFYYWYIPVVMIVIAYFIFKLDQRFDRTKTNRIASWKLALPLWILSLALAFVGIRGGMQGRSINILTAFNEGAFELGHLRLNTPFYFLRTYNIPRVKKKNWYTKVELAEKIQNLRIKSQYQGLEKQNVVLIILESFSQEYVEEGYAPFLLELSQQGLYFSQNFANGRRSIEVLSSVLDGIPSIQDVPFSRSSPQAMPVTGFVKRLKEEGYQTSFFHGANVFTMGFKNYALAHGVDNYYSREDYDGPESDFDGNWGIFDGPYLDFTARKLSQTKEPFFAGFLSISSHHPFNLPEEYKDKFPSDGLPIHKTIRYTDQMLREFFEKIKNTDFYLNTLFVITADHTHQMTSKKFNNSLGLYRVPLILFHPKHSFEQSLAQKITQHIDISPTVLDFLNIPASSIVCGGESVLSKGAGRAYHYLNPGWQYLSGDLGVKWTEGQKPEYFQWNAQTGESKPIESTEKPLSELKLFIQYYFEGFVDQQWPFVCAE